MQTRNVAVIGMGRLGLCLAAILAKKGFSVTGVDLNTKLVEEINAGHSPYDEPGLREMVTANRARLRATTSHGEAVASSDITIILVATPSDAEGVMSSARVEEAARSVGQALKSKKGGHLVLLSSTVMPGTVEGRLLPAFEEASGKKCGVDFGFCYVPEFVAVGTVIRDMLKPGLIVVGEQEPGTWPLLKAFFDQYMADTPRFHRMNLVNAELAKITLNACVAAKIGFANVLAGLCERIPGADVDAITAAVGNDPRVGPKAFTAGLGFGGPCFTKDIKSFIGMLGGAGLSPALFEALDDGNESIIHRLLGYVTRLLDEKNGADKVAILGMAFKPGVSSIEGSSGVALAKLLLAQSRKVIIHDPLAMEEARRVFGASVEYAASVDECLRAASVAVFTTQDLCYKNLQAADFLSLQSPPGVVDCWRLFGFLKNAGSVKYLPLGIFTEPPVKPH